MFYKTRAGVELKVEATADGRKVVEAIVAGIGNVDAGMDRIHKGAFKKTISERFKKAKPSRVKVMREHRDLIGIPDAMEEQDEGLYTRSLISKTALGEDTVVLIGDGVIDKASIGYGAVKTSDTVEDGKTIRELHELKLYEYSFLAFPMNEATRILGAKGLSGALLADVLERLMGDDEDEGGRVKVTDIGAVKRVLLASHELTAMLDALVKGMEPTTVTPPPAEPPKADPASDPALLLQSVRDAIGGFVKDIRG